MRKAQARKSVPGVNSACLLQRQVGLLQDVVRVRHARNQPEDEGVEHPLGAGDKHQNGSQ